MCARNQFIFRLNFSLQTTIVGNDLTEIHATFFKKLLGFFLLFRTCQMLTNHWVCIAELLARQIQITNRNCSGVFSTRNIGTIYYCHHPLVPAILGQSISTVSTCNSKVLNTPLRSQFILWINFRWIFLIKLQHFKRDINDLTENNETLYYSVLPPF